MGSHKDHGSGTNSLCYMRHHCTSSLMGQRMLHLHQKTFVATSQEFPHHPECHWEWIPPPRPNSLNQMQTGLLWLLGLWQAKSIDHFSSRSMRYYKTNERKHKKSPCLVIWAPLLPLYLDLHQHFMSSILNPNQSSKFHVNPLIGFCTILLTIQQTDWLLFPLWIFWLSEAPCEASTFLELIALLFSIDSLAKREHVRNLMSEIVWLPVWKHWETRYS